MLLRAVPIALSLLAGHAFTQGQLWVVDQAGLPGSDFTEIQPAVDAVADGDTLLVRHGDYGAFTIDGKALVVVEDTGASATAGALVVRNLAAGQTVSIRGVSPVTIALTSNSGAVLLESLDIGFLFGTCLPVGTGQALTIDACANVVAVRCSFFSGVTGALAYDGIDAKGSSLHLYETTVGGGTAFAIGAISGGIGVDLFNSFLFASGCTFYGGCGTTGELCTTGGNGGAALRLSGAESEGYLLETVLDNGEGACAGGYPFCGSCGFDGFSTGNFETVAGYARDYSLASPGTGGQTTPLSYAGKPGDLVFSVVGLSASPLHVPDLTGTLIPALPPIVIAHGPADPAGALALSVALPPLPPGIGAFTVFAQGAAISGVGAVVLASPTQLSIL